MRYRSGWSVVTRGDQITINTFSEKRNMQNVQKHLLIVCLRFPLSEDTKKYENYTFKIVNFYHDVQQHAWVVSKSLISVQNTEEKSDSRQKSLFNYNSFLKNYKFQNFWNNQWNFFLAKIMIEEHMRISFQINVWIFNRKSYDSSSKT